MLKPRSLALGGELTPTRQKFISDVWTQSVTIIPTTDRDLEEELLLGESYHTPKSELDGVSDQSKWRRWCSIAFHRMRNELLISPSAGAFTDGETQEISVLKDQRIDFTWNNAGGGRDGRQTSSEMEDPRSQEIWDWIIVALIGFATAMCAAWIGFVAEHLSDLRFGFCRGLPWLNRQLCCGSTSAVDILNNACLPVARLGSHFLGDGASFKGSLLDTNASSQTNDADVGGALSLILPKGVNQIAAWTSWSSFIDLGWNVDFLCYVFIGTFSAYASGVLVLALAPAAAGSGIPEVKTILGGFWLRRMLDPWTLVVKTMALALAVASGMGLGKEGPMVHIGAAWANILARFMPKFSAVHRDSRTYSPAPSRLHALISAGSAAGVAAAFGAPLGGVLFALEEVSSYFPPSTLYKTLFCAVAGAITLKNVSLSSGGNGTIFKVDSLGGSWDVKELPAFLLLGAAGGIVGACFIVLSKQKTLLKIGCKQGYVDNWLARIIFHGEGLRETVIVGAVANLLNYAAPMLRISSSFTMSQLFSRCGQQDPRTGLDVLNLCTRKTINGQLENNISWQVNMSLMLAFVLYSINALLTYGVISPAGLFVPSLTIGSILGRLFGNGMVYLERHAESYISCNACINPGVYSLLGAIAVLSGVSRMTVSLVIIAFEMSGGLAYIVPFMLVTLVAKAVSERVSEPSIYDDAIKIKKYPFLHINPLKSDEALAYGVSARGIITQEVVCISLAQQWTLRWILTLLTDFTFSHYPVIRDIEDRFVKGVINRKQLMRVFEQIHSNGSVRATYGDVKVSFEPLNEPESKTLDFSFLVHPVLITAHPNSTLSHVHQLFVQLGLSYIIFSEEGRLVGVLSKKAFLARLEKLRCH